MKKQIKETLYGFIVAVILLGGSSFVYAQTWSTTWVPMPSNPPSGNIPAPIHTGVDAQVKRGFLQIENGLAVMGTTLFSGGLKIPAGAGNGKVLTSDAAGVATWKDLPAVCRAL